MRGRLHLPRRDHAAGLPRRALVLAAAVCLLLCAGHAQPQTTDVSGLVQAIRQDKRASPSNSAAGVVVWLDPVSPADKPATARTGGYRLIQRDKRFTPHLMVVPVGSAVEFPNQDPFFHNVFSLFDGKRFDLGLYEAGSTRTVRFDHEGVSYIFCNIHPEMSAVIIALSTPYYAVSQANGDLLLHNVPPGAYQMHVWMEGGDPKQMESLARRVRIGPSERSLGTIRVNLYPELLTHKNKFGEDYPPAKPAY